MQLLKNARVVALGAPSDPGELQTPGDSGDFWKLRALAIPATPGKLRTLAIPAALEKLWTPAIPAPRKLRVLAIPATVRRRALAIPGTGPCVHPIHAISCVFDTANARNDEIVWVKLEARSVRCSSKPVTRGFLDSPTLSFWVLGEIHAISQKVANGLSKTA